MRKIILATLFLFSLFLTTLLLTACTNQMAINSPEESESETVTSNNVLQLSRPELYLSLITENSTQYFQAAQLCGNWQSASGLSFVQAVHPLNFWVEFEEEESQDLLDNFIAHLSGIEGRIELQFSEDHLPRTINVWRWRAEFVGMASDVQPQDKSFVELDGHTFYITNDGYDYIYEITAAWLQGDSIYTFRINSGNE